MLLKREFIFPHNFLDHLIKLTKKKKFRRKSPCRCLFNQTVIADQSVREHIKFN